MKMFKRVSMLVCAVSAFMLFSITASASFPNYPYNVQKGELEKTSYTNSTTQSTYNVTVNTRPDQTNAVVKVRINPYNDLNSTVYDVGSQNFPGHQDVPPINFELPPGRTYYTFITTDMSFAVTGILTAEY